MLILQAVINSNENESGLPREKCLDFFHLQLMQPSSSTKNVISTLWVLCNLQAQTITHSTDTPLPPVRPWGSLVFSSNVTP